MDFISYAQNFEDVVLWRALKDVGEGFYVDVGAQDPKVDSVTLAFYERGWKGINIEASAEYFELLTAARPRDTNIHAFASNQQSLTRFFSFPETGLSTFDPVLAEQHQNSGFSVRECVVPSVTLTEVLDTCKVQTIHFLKVDVEGAERLVFEGLDLAKHRPWVILAEATKPSSQEPSHENFEGILTGAGYQFCYFDGINRYYVASERFDQIAPILSRPPNYFDHFIRNAEFEAQREGEAAQDELRQTRQMLVTLKNQLDTIRSSSIQSKRNLADIAKALTQGVRKHFGKKNLKIGDPEPRYNLFKRLFRSAFRKQGGVNKALLSAFCSQLAWNQKTEERLTELQGAFKILNERVRKLAADGNPAGHLANEDVSHLSASAKQAYVALCEAKTQTKR